MRRPLKAYSATAVVVLLVAGLVLPGTALAATVKVAKDQTALEESWYYRYRQPLEPIPDAPGDTGDPLPTQQDNVKAQIRSRSNPYEAETLHVGINAGQPEARMFLYWDPFTLSDTGLATVVGGTATLPLHADARGVRNAANASMIACLNIDLPTSDLAGEWDEQPEYDCKTSAPVEPVKDSDPLVWTVNLDVFGAKWKQDPTSYSGISIVEDPEAPESPETSTWHVAFAGQYNQADVEKVTADIKYEVEEFVLPDFDDDLDFGGDDDFTTGGGSSGEGFEDDGGFESDPGFGPDGSVAAPGGGGFSAAPPPSSSLPPSVDVSADPAPALAAPGATTPVAVQGVTEPQAITNPFGYWLLPILGLALAAAMGWSLTRPVELVKVREGAVSRLMRTRPGSA